jgi:Domain of unknown function (DUF4129)
LDPTPAADIGTLAAESTMLGAWQGRWHGIERFWDQYIVDMDRKRQRESVYEPISRTASYLMKEVVDPGWWKGLAARLWAALEALLRSGVMGWLFGLTVLMAILILPLSAGWWLARRLVRLWRRLSARGKSTAGARSSIEFYRRFELIAARLGLQRRAGQTPREFAGAAGSRLADVSGRVELTGLAVQVVEEFYRVRFGRHDLDEAASAMVQQALNELTAGAEKIGPARRT